MSDLSITKPQETFEQRYQKLNSKQKEAVDAIFGLVMVVAGPGSGKTELLGLRVANILQKTDTAPSSILCLTYTDAAANNMLERLKSIIGEDAHKVNFFTFHSFAKNIIEQYPQYFFNGTSAEPIDDLQQTRIIHTILNQLNIDNLLFSANPNQKHFYLNAVKTRIGELKKAGLTPNDYQEVLNQNQAFFEDCYPILADFFNQTITNKLVAKLPDLIQTIQNLGNDKYFINQNSFYQTYKSTLLEKLELVWMRCQNLEKRKTTPLTEFKTQNFQKNIHNLWQLKDALSYPINQSLFEVYNQYQDYLSNNQLYDFEDMLIQAVTKIEQNLDLRLTLSERYQFIMVDEFQDTSGVQMAFINQLIDNPDISPNLMVVGDDDQAIFKFQGASLDNILGFEKRYSKDIKAVVLDKNYRSKQVILDFAKLVVEQIQDRLTKRMGIDKPLLSVRDN